MESPSYGNHKAVTPSNYNLRSGSGTFSFSANSSPVRLHSSSPLNNDNSPKKDMFYHRDPVAQVQQIQKNVSDLQKLSTVLKTVIDKHVELVGPENALDKCKAHTEKVYQKMTDLIEQNSSPSSSPCGSTILSCTSNRMPNGTQCKKNEAKSILEEQAILFTNLSKRLIDLAAVSRHSTDIEGMQIQLKEIRAQVAKSQEDYKDIETLISGVLSRLGPTVRHYHEKRDAKIQHYSEFLNYQSKFALFNCEYAIYLPFLEANINLLRMGKDISEKMKNERETLLIDVSKKQFEIDGIVPCAFKMNKDVVLGHSIHAASTNFHDYTRDAMTYKGNLQEYLKKGVKYIDEQYFIDLALGDTRQRESNIEKCRGVNNKAQKIQGELTNDIVRIWQEVTESQKQLYGQLVHSVSRLTGKNEFNNGSQSSPNSDKKLLNPDVNAIEMEPEWMKGTKF